MSDSFPVMPSRLGSSYTSGWVHFSVSIYAAAYPLPPIVCLSPVWWSLSSAGAGGSGEVSNFPLFLVTLHFDLILPLSFLDRINTCLPSFSLLRTPAVAPELKNCVQQEGTAQNKRGESGDPEKALI